MTSPQVPRRRADAQRSRARILDAALRLLNTHPDASVEGTLSPDWLVAVTATLGHAASDEVEAGRMSDTEAAHALRTSLFRVLGAAAPAPPAL